MSSIASGRSKPDGKMHDCSAGYRSDRRSSGVERLLCHKVPLGWLALHPGLRHYIRLYPSSCHRPLPGVYYSPSPDHAYDSIQFIMYEVPFGAVVRGIHHWTASAMVVLVVVHMATVFVLGAQIP